MLNRPMMIIMAKALVNQEDRVSA